MNSQQNQQIGKFCRRIISYQWVFFMQCRPLVYSSKFSLHIEILRIKQLVLDFYSLCKITMSPVLQEDNN